MMEGLNNWDPRLVISFTLCLYLLFQSTEAQEGFLSIRCCAETKFWDSSTNITWITDKDWYPNRENCQEIIKPEKNSTVHDKARFFTSTFSSKWCYNLTTTKDQHYLIRSKFLTSDLQSKPSDLHFNVFIGATPIGVVNSPKVSEIEGVFKATDEQTNFCLVKEKGDPYISTLELRPLNLDYLNVKPSTVLKLVKRVDVGSTGAEIRYPQDPYDRIWKPESKHYPNANFISSSTASIVITKANKTLPPMQVLKTALTNPERLEFTHNDLNNEYYNYYLCLYFLEPSDSVQARQRVFEIYINDEQIKRVDIVAGGSRYSIVILNFTANGVFNLTMIKDTNESQLGPICSAYEILQVHPWIEHTTQEDVNAVVDMQTKLLENNHDNEVIKGWSGDPCLPIPWHGLLCESTNGTPVIIELDLSSSNLKGSLPTSVSQLIHLKKLDISNNQLTSTIPAFPATSWLTSIDLRHNNLMGEIPESLTLLPNLNTLYFGCNPNLSNVLPTSFNSEKLTTDNGKCSGQKSSSPSQTIVIGTVGASFFACIAAGFTCFCKRKVKAKGKVDRKGHPMIKNAVYSISSMDDIALKSISIQNFTLEYIENVTQSYKALIGEGGFGSVYRGTLPDGQEVAVKVRSATSTQGTREFNNELNLLSAIQHGNLVPLLGYCCENDQQILVYPFMSNGSLQDRLYGEAAKRKPLDWPIRLSIALGAARGLTYLHTFSGRSVIHRDVKSSNILLDQSMCAKVADFGFSKYAPQEGDSGTSLEVRGTAGYLDPEYYSTQNLSAKSDVFSFGVVLLEIISGREPLNIRRPRNEWSLVEWAKANIRNARIDDIVDLTIKEGYHAEAMWRVVEVALACIEPFSAQRPCMEDVIRELEDALIIENNASEYMKSIDSFGGSNRFSIERTTIIPTTSIQMDLSPVFSQPGTPQLR